MSEFGVYDDVVRRAVEAASSHPLAVRRVRVVRVLVYEGRGVDVLRTLARSLPVGTKTVGSVLSIAVHQEPTDDLGPWTANMPDLDADDERAMLAFLQGEEVDDQAIQRLGSRLRQRVGG